MLDLFETEKVKWRTDNSYSAAKPHRSEILNKQHFRSMD